jgi:predicted Kef-type K+ transport protein
MLAVWIAGAFALGLLARSIGMPPLVGFLAAGFLMKAGGLASTPALDEIAHLGVLLLLFTVGLKLRIRNLLRAEVWGVAILQFAAVLAIAMVALRTLPDMALAPLLAVASAFAFSSTVLAAKLLEQKREIRGFHGRVVIGILIVQDIIAVAILAGNGTSELSWTALLVLPLLVMRPVFESLLNLAGHGELLVLFGAALALAIGGYGFEAVGLSPELGALLVGMLLAEHPRAVELGDSLWSIKEFFLVGFFLSIGLTGLPTWETLQLASVPIVLLPLKLVMFFLLLMVFGVSARTGFLAGLTLTTYSEFGLIVMDAAVDRGMVPGDWLVATAIAVAVSFAITAPLMRVAHDIYPPLERWLKVFERRKRHPDDEPLSLGKAEVVVLGMGRVGTGAYDYIRDLGERVVGMDSDQGKVARHLREGRRVVYADAEDPGLWHRLRLDRVRVIVLAVPDLEAKLVASEQLRKRGFRGLISATYLYPEELKPILQAGANVAYNYFTEAGVGLAANTFEAIEEKLGAGDEPASSAGSGTRP